MVRVIAYARLHLGLVDCSGDTLRTFGGIGVFVAQPNVVVAAEPSVETELENVGLVDQQTQFDIRDALDRLKAKRACGGFRVTIEASPPQHVGLGSKTALVLASVTAAATTRRLELSRQEIQKLSGRGGTSGVGVNGFFCGGLVVDAGHKKGTQFLPSSARLPEELPPMTVHCAFPESWRIALFIPATSVGVSGRDEVDFFRRVLPLEPGSALAPLAAIYHGVLPAVETRDLGALRNALNVLRASGLKELEIANHPGVGPVLDRLDAARLPCGMSSMGPLVFAIYDQDDAAARIALASCSDELALPFIEVSAVNRGYSLIDPT